VLQLLAQVGPMSIAYPAIAVGAAAAVSIPIIIHLLTKLRRRPQPWAAMRFLIQVQRRHRHRLRIEQWLLLTLRCLIPLVLGLALSGPVLSGCRSDASGLFGALGSDRGRLVCLVIDDTLSAQAIDGSGRTRFDQLRESAIKIIDGLSSTDRVMVWRAAQPAVSMSVSAREDQFSVRRLIELMEPRYSRSDLVKALLMVDETLSQDTHPVEQVFIIVISDFANHVLPPNQPTPKQLVALSQRGKLIVTRPMPEAANVQITSLKVPQHVILAAPGQPSPTVPVELHLRRFVDDESRSLTSLRLTVVAEDSSIPIATVRTDHRWFKGQNEAVIHANIPLAELRKSGVLGMSGSLNTGQALSVFAEIEAADEFNSTDALAGDNQQWAVLTLRQRIRIGLIDQAETDQRQSQMSNDLTPSRWMRLALDPKRSSELLPLDSKDESRVNDSVMMLEMLDATRLNQEELDQLDVAIVLRPDLIESQLWIRLRQLADRGGLVWLFPPTIQSTQPWSSVVSDTLGLNRQWGNEPIEVTSADRSGQTLAVDDTVPEPLKLLSADWRALLVPIRIRKRFELILRSSTASPESVWLKTVDGKPLLISVVAGQGRILLGAFPIDPQWTNLPTKPLFVPFLHETIRGALSTSSASKHQNTVICGQRPILGEVWMGAKSLVLNKATNGQTAVLLEESSMGLEPKSALNTPGIYSAVPSVGQALAVNPDAIGGDTRSLDEHRLTQWFSEVGQWSWLDPRNPERQLVTTVQRVNLSWPLLWVTLGIVVIEMILARWFSYATVPGEGLISRLASFRFGRHHIVRQRMGS